MNYYFPYFNFFIFYYEPVQLNFPYLKYILPFNLKIFLFHDHFTNKLKQNKFLHRQVD